MFNTLLLRSGLTRNANWTRFVTRWLILGLALHVIAAVQSTGFIHNDEHFQIVEFANSKLSTIPPTDLPLEFREMMRPWLFPAILMVMTRFLHGIGVTSPFDWALAYRVFSSFVGFLGLTGLVLCCFPWFEDRKWRERAVMALTLAWFLPALHARHSSENLGGSVFFIGLSLLILASPEKDKHLDRPREVSFPTGLLSGLLFGLAFEFRYQVGIMVAGALLWLLCVARVSIRQFLPILLGTGLAIGIGTLIDCWGYQQWTFAPWNYLQHNLIQNHVSDSDISPWWDYLRRAVTESWPALGLLTLLSFVLAWLRNPLHVLTWSMLPLFITHLVIGHKEIRFLYPLVHVSGVLLILSICPIQWPAKWPQRWRPYPGFQAESYYKWLRWPIWLIIGFNILSLIVATIAPVWMPYRFYRQLYTFKPYGFQLYYKDENLFNFGGALMHFYLPSDLNPIQIKEYSELDPILEQTKKPLWLFHPRDTLPETAGDLKEACQIEFSTLPPWLNRFNYQKRFPNVSNWTLFRCQGE